MVAKNNHLPGIILECFPTNYSTQPPTGYHRSVFSCYPFHTTTYQASSWNVTESSNWEIGVLSILFSLGYNVGQGRFHFLKLR